MRKLNRIVNIILIPSFIISVVISVLIYNGLSKEIGNIKYDANTDNKNFEINGYIYQYYQSGAQYFYGRAAIRSEILDKIKALKSIQNGYVTARFVVNHRGETDRYRLLVVDTNYEKMKISQDDNNLIIKELKSLNNWIPGVIKNKKVDSYSLINFKIQHGKIVDIF
ncbi:hypothetical protein [Chryseobacterium salivictor]|uniref:Gram-negative bacterial tonB protein n=1 Tax=Chryseobacterium salivictor TaxID=2547600 RepID=A0A4P6ZFS5_9FLAO|nr:hypothetical protein [Chryseobacterium salivictor]QBO58417.1 hypothetical protein NBC122_01602 [Chryseobacterium salivictor]